MTDFPKLSFNIRADCQPELIPKSKVIRIARECKHCRVPSASLKRCLTNLAVFNTLSAFTLGWNSRA
jgi:hypothetical protein